MRDIAERKSFICPNKKDEGHSRKKTSHMSQRKKREEHNQKQNLYMFQQKKRARCIWETASLLIQ